MKRLIPIALASVVAGCAGRGDRSSGASGKTDSAFAALQTRGAEAMGVDQYTSSHVFEPLADGGRIVLQRDVPDSAGVVVIRAHLRDIAQRFAAGDFSIPGMVHAQAVPGTAVMAARRAHIRYIADTLPLGGEVRLVTTDSAALAAIHEFLAFQRMDHRAAMHEHADSAKPVRR